MRCFRTDRRLRTKYSYSVLVSERVWWILSLGKIRKSAAWVNRCPCQNVNELKK